MVYIQRAFQSLLIISIAYLLVGFFEAQGLLVMPSVFYSITVFIMGFFAVFGSLISAFPPYK
ncbi:MAG: hypothetical protein Q7S92_00630 [Candidatus Diapherotrites archaeon]|nr:hypothetical protein [Candidatus Diapherotrites archaeon]